MSTLAQHFGGYIQELRHDQGITVVDLASSCDLSPGSIRAYEQGRRTPSAIAYKKILKALGAYRESDWVDDLVWVHPETGQPFDVARDAGFHPKKQAQNFVWVCFSTDFKGREHAMAVFSTQAQADKWVDHINRGRGTTDGAFWNRMPVDAV